MEALLAPSLKAARAQQDGCPDEKIFHMKDHLFLGSAHGAADRALLDALGIRAVVNLTSGRHRVPNHFEGSGIEYVHLELADELISNPNQAVPTACKAIRRWEKEGKRVLVHCHAGLSRSTTAVLAWLMWQRGLSLAEGAWLLCEKRGRRPRCNPSFWCFLAALERELRGWPPGSRPSFDFTAWLVEDLRAMGLTHEESKLVRALQLDADWVDFASFYTAVSGTGFNTMVLAQRVAQRANPEVKSSCKAAGAALELMEVYRSWPAAQAFCMRVLQPLLLHSDSRPAEHIFQNGVAIKVLTGMRSHEDVVDVQEAGCGTLAFFSACAPNYAAEVVLLSGVETVLKALAAHLTSEVLQTTGCVALLALAQHPESLARVSALGGAAALRYAMQAHPEAPRLQQLGQRVLMAISAAEAAGGTPTAPRAAPPATEPAYVQAGSSLALWTSSASPTPALVPVPLNMVVGTSAKAKASLLTERLPGA